MRPHSALRIGLALAALVVASASASARGPWVTLFDGKSTDAWRGYRQQTFPSDAWTVENGALKGALSDGKHLPRKVADDIRSRPAV